MDEIRRADGPRLIDWTGERMVPWTQDVQVVYEHLHRYWLAAAAAAGKRVLDLGSGEGYGSAILATVADEVVGLDLAQEAVDHAHANYAAPNLRFQAGSALDLSGFAEGSFDLVVCFEVIEHLAEQEELLAGIDRVLAPDGVLICSTPDRLMYEAMDPKENPFHVRELSAAEFKELLGSRFAHVRSWGQRTVAGSLLADAEGVGPEAKGSTPIFVEREGDDWRRAAAPLPVYHVAVAGNGELPALTDQSVLVDAKLTILRELHDAVALARRGEGAAQAASAQLLERIAFMERSQRHLMEGIAARRAELEVQRTMRAEAEKATAAAEGTIDYLWGEIVIAHDRLKKIDASVSYRVLERARAKVEGEPGSRGLARKVVSAVVPRVGRKVLTAAVPAPAPAAEEVAAEAPEATLHFPDHPEPRVSIVIPVHDEPDLTLKCLKAISYTTEGIAYEVVVVDDASGPELQEALQTVAGLRVLRNEANQHYLRTTNRGIAAARGEYVVLLNNDTEPKEGWLEALVETADADPSVGAVGAKLLLPDGRVQEAGAIVWSDASAWHVGRNEHPDEPRLNYVRDVDYASAACLLVRRDAIERLGGLDERFVPAYYEDVDLCFGIRSLGLRVVYQPLAEVTHHEGGSHGTDVTVGVKAHQVTNQAVFAEKWADVLAAEHPAFEPEAEHRHQDRRRGTRVLVVDHQVPAMHEDAGSMRMHHMLQALVAVGCRVTFLPDNREPRQPHTRELQQSGVEVLYGGIQERLVFGQMGDDLKLAILSRPTVAYRYLYLLREFNRYARVAYDTVDLHYLREERRAVVNDDATLQRVSEIFLEMERGLVRTCDETIAVSQDEVDAIRDLVPGAEVSVLPTLHPVVEWAPPAAGREGLLFLGGFDHQPNVDAALALVRDVLPHVHRELGVVPVWIVGSRPPAKVAALAEVPGVEVTGFVEEIEPYFDRARLLAAPIPYGAGVKGKITQSMALGLPVVTTPIGAEGLQAAWGTDLLVGATPEELAAAIVRAYRDDELWTGLSDAGRALAERRFSPAVAQQVLDDLLERAVARVGLETP